MRLAGAIGAVRLAVRGVAVRSWVHGFAVRGSWVRRSWVRRSWVRCSWVMGSLFVGSRVRGFAVRGFNDLQLTISPVLQRSQLSGFAISLSLCLRVRASACESFCVVSAELVRVCGESRAHGERRACACAW